ncbi:MAG TPA: hypothetical protein VHZ07_27750 [Bryobacteraceae bacterium]|jgi:hypothetical protein|nr:hypothetical protein [Bryobacteraceae bacterium]
MFAHIWNMNVPMKAKSRTRVADRRQPKQRRARQTVEAVLDAVVRIMKREGVKTVTTNRVADLIESARAQAAARNALQRYGLPKGRSQRRVALSVFPE